MAGTGPAAHRGPRPAALAGPSTRRRSSRTWRGSGSRPIAGLSGKPTTTAYRGRARAPADGPGPRLRLRLLAFHVRGLGAGHGPPWHGPGCPGGCRRPCAWPVPCCGSALGEADPEAWTDRVIGPCSGDVATDGDLAVRDRDGNWTLRLRGRRRRPARGASTSSSAGATCSTRRRPRSGSAGCSVAAPPAFITRDPSAGRSQALEAGRQYRGPRAARGRKIARRSARPSRDVVISTSDEILGEQSGLALDGAPRHRGLSTNSDDPGNESADESDRLAAGGDTSSRQSD